MPIDLIVIHVTAGPEQAAIDWFQSIASHVSAHYSISKTGQIYQHVGDGNIAWHAGIAPPCIWSDESKNRHRGVNPNAYSIGIEHEGYDDGKLWPDAQVTVSAGLVADIARRYGFPVDAAHVVGHHTIYAGHSCPGRACPLDRIIALAQSHLTPAT